MLALAQAAARMPWRQSHGVVLFLSPYSALLVTLLARSILLEGQLMADGISRAGNARNNFLYGSQGRDSLDGGSGDD